MLGCHLVAALFSSPVFEFGVLLLGCPCAVFSCHRGVCLLCHLGSRPRPCRVLCRHRSCASGVFFFCRILCRWCVSRSRVLSALSGSPIRSVRILLHLPSCWLARAVLRVFGLSSARASQQ